MFLLKENKTGIKYDREKIMMYDFDVVDGINVQLDEEISLLYGSTVQ